MKKIFIILFASIICFSCSDKLELLPRASIAPETVTSDDIPKLFNGLYALMRNGNGGYPWSLGYLTEDLSSDNLVYRATFFQHGEIDNNAILTENLLVLFYWDPPYAIIQSANDLIETVTLSTSMSDEEKKVTIAEARAIRGYAYYRLVTLYGGAPIIETRDPDKQLVPRETEDKVWDYIIADLTAGLDARPYTVTGVYKMSVEAVKLLLSRVYLIRGNNVDAKKLADEVIASPSFALNSNYNAIWDVTNPSNEVIFAVQSTEADGEPAHGFFLRHPEMPGGGRGELPVDPTLAAAYEAGDKRSSLIVENNSYNNEKFKFWCYKYQDPGNMTSKFYIARVAEAYLISAEANIKLDPTDASGIALGRVNAIRTIRNASTLSSVDLHDIIHERRLELAFEGTRWTDMKRTPSKTNPSVSMALEFVTAKGRTVNDLLYPIPTSARDVNPELTQNAGY